MNDLATSPAGSGILMADQHDVAVKALKVGVLVSRLMRLGDAREVGDSFSQPAMSLLRVLHESPTTSIEQLEGTRMRSPLPVRALLEDMARAGLVVIATPRDGTTEVAMTETGRKVHAARQALLTAPLADMLATLTEEDRGLLREAITLLERLSTGGAGSGSGVTS